MANNAVATPKQTFTLNFSRSEVENKIRYMCEKLPTYVVINQTDVKI